MPDSRSPIPRRSTFSMPAHGVVGVTIMLAMPGLAACENGAGDPEPMSEQEKDSLQAAPTESRPPSGSQKPKTGTGTQPSAPANPGTKQAPEPPSTARPGPKGDGQGTGAATGEPLPDAKVEAFIEAYMKAQDAREGLREKLASAKSKDKALAIQQQATRQMQEAVESTGMDFETYTSLTRRLQADADFRSRVQKAMRKLGKAR